MTTSTKNWIEELKPGDYVKVSSKSQSNVRVVKELTKLHIILYFGMKFSKKTLLEVGVSAFCANQISALSLEDRARLKAPIGE